MKIKIRALANPCFDILLPQTPLIHYLPQKVSLYNDSGPAPVKPKVKNVKTMKTKVSDDFCHFAYSFGDHFCRRLNSAPYKTTKWFVKERKNMKAIVKDLGIGTSRLLKIG